MRPFKAIEEDAARICGDALPESPSCDGIVHRPDGSVLLALYESDAEKQRVADACAANHALLSVPEAITKRNEGIVEHAREAWIDGDPSSGR